MSILDIFRPLKKQTYQKWKELGTYQAVFNVFGEDAYKSHTVRSCVRPLAEFTSKAEARCSDKRIERILNYRPNMYMNGKDFLYKTRTLVEMQNNCFIYIQRNDKAQVMGFYPVPAMHFEAEEYKNGLFMRFYFGGDAARELVLPWADLVAVRKDYYRSDIAGEGNTAILDALKLYDVTMQGLGNAIKSTSNLRGILKSTKSMLAPEKIKEQKDEFVRDYMNLENTSGVASLDASQEFTPINMSPVTANYEQTKEIREDIYRYFNVNDDFVMSKLSPDQLEVAYELLVEPFLVRLSTELTSKVYAGKALSYENSIVYEANKLQFASLDKKIKMYKEVVLYGGMTINEWRAASNMAPLPDGDTPIMRLDAAKVDSPNATEEEENESEG